MRRTVAGVFTIVVAAAALAIIAAPAWAHSEFEPAEAPGGSTTAFTLQLENEQPDSGTTMVQLFFPEATPVVLAELPAVEGWETAVEGGAVGAPVTSVTWSRASASPDENPALPVTLGPLPTAGGRLQFKVLQTYANGEVDRWIEDWPEGAPEPENPGPVIQVAAGESPTTSATVSPTTAVDNTTTVSPTTAGDNTTTETTASPSADGTTNDDDSNTGVIVAIVIAAVVVLGGLGFVWWRRRARPTERGSA